MTRVLLGWLMLLALTAVLFAGLLTSASAWERQVSITFTPPTTNADGTPLEDLSGYIFCWALKPIVTAADCVNAWSFEKDKPQPVRLNLLGIPETQGTLYFGLMAFDSSGNRSTITVAPETIDFDRRPPSGATDVAVQ